jgi:hypothetical protein
MTAYTKRVLSYKEGYAAGVNATKSALRKGIEGMLSDDTEVIISEGEVFVPISAMREIIRKLEVK